MVAVREACAINTATDQPTTQKSVLSTNIQTPKDTNSSQVGRTLRIAIAVPGRPLSYGAQRVVKSILDDERYSICLIILEKPTPPASTWSVTSRALKLLDRAEHAVVGRSLPNSLSGAPKTIDDLAQKTNASVIATTALPDRSADFPETDIARIRRSDADIVVDLGCVSIATNTGIATAHGTIKIATVDHPGLQEVATDAGLTPATLLKFGAAAPQTLRVAHFKTQTSWARNSFFLADEAANLITDHLAAIHAGHEAPAAAAATPPPSVQPTISTVAKYTLRAARNLLAPKATQLVSYTGLPINRWSLFIGSGELSSENLKSTTETKPPRGEFWADPFIHKHSDGKFYVFFENYENSTARGKISVGHVKDGRIIVLGDALTTDYHLSFPFISTHRDELYMIPETAERRRIEIWRCRDFPLRWELRRTALHGISCTDTTLIKHQGKWWVLTNIARGSLDDHNSELHVFAADSPMLHQLTPHRANPVVINAKTARNGGRPFVRDDTVFRFAQNNAHRHYGHGLSLMRVTKLSLEDYEEHVECTYPPNFKSGVSRIHHADIAGDTFVCDGFRTFG